jgi:hypothetical protein
MLQVAKIPSVLGVSAGQTVEGRAISCGFDVSYCEPPAWQSAALKRLASAVRFRPFHEKPVGVKSKHSFDCIPHDVRSRPTGGVTQLVPDCTPPDQSHFWTLRDAFHYNAEQDRSEADFLRWHRVLGDDHLTKNGKASSGRSASIRSSHSMTSLISI